MAAINFPSYSRLDGLTSLVTKCVHTLCFPTANSTFPKAFDLSLPSLYDFNLLTNCNKRVRSKSPCRFLEQLYDSFHQSPQFKSGEKKSLLDINSRQSIIDYIIRERILVSCKFVIHLLQDGGVYNFDLWQLCEINEFTVVEVEQILNQMCLHSHVFRNLSIGGVSWIYAVCVTCGPLKKLLCKSGALPNLVGLKLMQIPDNFHFISLLHSCPNLVRLEISHPSLSDHDIAKMSTYLATNSLSICQSLRHVMLPSSVKEKGVMNFLAHFPKLTSLKCTPFEQLLDLLDMSLVNLSTFQYSAQRAMAVLANMQTLSMAHPMSCDTVDRLLKACPKIADLTLVVQEGMNLTKLTTHAPNLTKLALNNSHDMPLNNYLEHVAPILEGCGKRLESLSLENFDHIDLTNCAQHCPNLRTFSAQWFSTLTMQHRLHRLLMIKKPFSQLRHLRLRPRPHQSLSPEICSFLLNDANQLRHIELYCCSELTDETIFEINKHNQLNHLQTFILRHGHCVTTDALCKFVSQASASGNLVFHDCGLVPPVRKEEM